MRGGATNGVMDVRDATRSPTSYASNESLRTVAIAAAAAAATRYQGNGDLTQTALDFLRTLETIASSSAESASIVSKSFQR